MGKSSIFRRMRHERQTGNVSRVNRKSATTRTVLPGGLVATETVPLAIDCPFRVRHVEREGCKRLQRQTVAVCVEASRNGLRAFRHFADKNGLTISALADGSPLQIVGGLAWFGLDGAADALRSITSYHWCKGLNVAFEGAVPGRFGTIGKADSPCPPMDRTPIDQEAHSARMARLNRFINRNQAPTDREIAQKARMNRFINRQS